MDGTGCTPKSNLTQCSLSAATAESCVLYSFLADLCPLEGNSCSDGALSFGCVNSNDDSNDAASIVRISSLLVLVAMLSLLLF